MPLQNIYLYDAVQVLALALNKTLSLNESIEDGMKVVSNMKGITYLSEFNCVFCEFLLYIGYSLLNFTYVCRIFSPISPGLFCVRKAFLVALSAGGGGAYTMYRTNFSDKRIQNCQFTTEDRYLHCQYSHCQLFQSQTSRWGIQIRIHYKYFVLL